MPSIEEIEARRAARKAAADEERRAQAAKDLEAVDAMEVASGEEIRTLAVPQYRKGLPALVGVRAPEEAYYKRFAQMLRRSADNREAHAQAQDMLADHCWCYPPADAKDERAAMLKAFPALLVSIFLESIKLIDAKAEDEKKG